MIVTVAQQKGGVGKTTTVLNVAAELTRGGRRVLAVDLDPQFALTRQLGVVGSSLPLTLVDVLGGRADVGEVLIGAHGLSLVPGHRDLAGVELALVGELGRERFVAEALAGVTAEFDDVVIDTPPNLGLLTVNGLLPADLVLAPVSAEDEGSAQGLCELQATVMRLERLRERRALPLVAVTTKWHERRIMTEVVEKAIASLGIPVIGRIPKRAVIQQAAVHRVPVRTLDGRTGSASAYAELAAYIRRSQLS